MQTNKKRHTCRKCGSKRVDDKMKCVRIYSRNYMRTLKDISDYQCIKCPTPSAERHF